MQLATFVNSFQNGEKTMCNLKNIHRNEKCESTTFAETPMGFLEGLAIHMYGDDG